MANTTNVNIRMDAELKKRFEKFCDDMGMSMTTAFTVFAKKAVREYRIPFEIGIEVPHSEMMEAIREAEEIKRNPGNYKKYGSFREILEELDKEEDEEI